MPAFVSWVDFSRCDPIDPANARLRAVMEDLLGREQWRLLWVPPTLPGGDAG